MNYELRIILLLILIINNIQVISQKQNDKSEGIIYASDIKCGADRTELYLDKLQNKKVGILANQTSCIGKTHIVDSLLKKGIKITRIFCPEHGFRGEAEAGELVNNKTDNKNRHRNSIIVW